MKRGILFLIVMAIALASLAQDWTKIIVGPDKPNKTELQSLKGVAGNVQGQLDAKADMANVVSLAQDVYYKAPIDSMMDLKASLTYVNQNAVHTIWPLDGISSGLPANTTGNTNENTILTITIPANSIGSNGRLDFIGAYSMNSNTNAKYLRIYINGDALPIVTAGNNSATGQSGSFFVKMWNRNSKSSQWILPYNTATGPVLGWSGTLTGAGGGLTKNYNTSEALTVVLKTQLAVGTDNIQLETFQIVATP